MIFLRKQVLGIYTWKQKRKVLLEGGLVSRTAKAGVNPERSPCASTSSGQDNDPRSPQLHVQPLRRGISSYTSCSCAEAITVTPPSVRSSSAWYHPIFFPKFLKKSSRSYGLSCGLAGSGLQTTSSMTKSFFLLPLLFFSLWQTDRFEFCQSWVGCSIKSQKAESQKRM